jgi:hypothetical protein
MESTGKVSDAQPELTDNGGGNVVSDDDGIPVVNKQQKAPTSVCRGPRYIQRKRDSPEVIEDLSCNDSRSNTHTHTLHPEKTIFNKGPCLWTDNHGPIARAGCKVIYKRYDSPCASLPPKM